MPSRSPDSFEDKPSQVYMENAEKLSSAHCELPKGSDDVLRVEAGEAEVDVAHAAMLRKQILWKLDTRILPVLAFLFLFSFLDRTNVGNVRLLGLQKDLKLTTRQYENCLAIYYAFYIASEVPSNLLLKVMTPKVLLPLLTFFWGAIASCMGVAKTYKQFLAIRALLGVAEGGLLPGMVLYLSMLYKRDEMALRMGLVYSSASLSGAFGGLLATGINHMNGRAGYAGWRWILIMEGVMTMIVAIVAYFLLVSSVETAHFLTPEQRIFAAARLATDRPAPDDSSATDRFSWYQVRRAIFSIQTWLSALAYFAILSALYSFGLFIPTIITGLGYTAIEAQLRSVPPYAVAAFLTVVVAILSDRQKTRGPWMLLCLPFSIAGYAILRTSTSNHTRYGALFLCAAGLYTSVPPVLVWLSNNSLPHYKRATAAAFQLSVANAGGFVATFIYPSVQGPRYVEGHTIILGLLCAAWVLVALNVAYVHHLNKRKASGKMEIYRGRGDDRDPDFKYIM